MVNKGLPALASVSAYLCLISIPAVCAFHGRPARHPVRPADFRRGELCLPCRSLSPCLPGISALRGAGRTSLPLPVSPDEDPSPPSSPGVDSPPPTASSSGFPASPSPGAASPLSGASGASASPASVSPPSSAAPGSALSSSIWPVACTVPIPACPPKKAANTRIPIPFNTFLFISRKTPF